VDSLRINKQTSNLKFVRAMLASRGWNCAILGQKVLCVGAQIAARVAKAREVNDGLRALFLPPHGRHPRTIAEAIRAKGHQISHEGVGGVLRQLRHAVLLRGGHSWASTNSPDPLTKMRLPRLMRCFQSASRF
jgi:hypothetical protein